MRRLPVMGLFCLTAFLSSFCAEVRSALVVWNIDSGQSFIRMNFADANQTIQVNLGSPVGTRPIDTTFSMRDADSTEVWTDNGGRRSAVAGTITTEYDEVGGVLNFLSGLHDMSAVNSGSFRPNPAAFSGGSYNNTSAAPAAFAAKIRGIGSGVTGDPGLPIVLDSDLAFFALRNVSYDSNGAISLTGAGGNFSGSGGIFGIQGGNLDADNLEFNVQVVGFQNPTPVAPIAPDEQGTALVPSLVANNGSLSILNLGGLDRRLTQLINTELQLTVGGITFNGTMEGQIVAFASVPEPASASLLATALCLAGFRRRKKD